MEHLRTYPSLLLVVLFAVLIFSSCSEEENIDSASGGTSVALRVSVIGITENDEKIVFNRKRTKTSVDTK